jgi:anti-sigma B factor antagonist
MNLLGFEVRTAAVTPSTYVVSVVGEVDSFTAPALEKELEWVLGDGASNAVVDLAGVGFIDSMGLRVLLEALPRFTKRGGKLVLVSDDRRVLRTLEITGLDDKFVLEPRLSEAIAEVVGEAPVPSADGRGQ